MSGTTPDITESNIEKLKQLFPEIVTDGKIDFEKLEILLGKEIDDTPDRYNFTWHGKKETMQFAQQPSKGTLRPMKGKSKHWDTTDNLYIEGDNLEVLKLLQKSYNNKVKMIYIDPPYNTGNDFVYKDNFNDNVNTYLELTNQKDNEGKRFSSNTESNGRYHTDWLNMMYPRLKLARNLLTNNGVIFISIDDNEVNNLKKICDEIFGETNFVGQFPWQSRQSIQNDTDMSSSHEYVLAYAKNRRQENRRLKESNADKWFKDESFVFLPLPLVKDKFANPDNDSRGLWKADPFDAPKIRPNLTYKIQNPNTGVEYLPPTGRHWRTEQKTFEKLLADNRIVFGKTGNSKPQLKVFYEEKKMFGSINNTWWTGEKYGTSTQGTKEQMQLFEGFAPFDTPKPVKLLKQILSMVSLPNNNDIILDFFSGSATTAHATMQLNAEDGGNRKFIMVQLPEILNEKTEAYKKGFRTICDIGEDRIRRAGEKVKSNLIEKNNKKGILSEGQINPEQLDIGFKVFSLDTSNLTEWQAEFDDIEVNIDLLEGNLVEGRSEEDLLYEIILKNGLDLTYPIKEVISKGTKIYDVAFGNLFVCLNNKINRDVAHQIASLREEYGIETSQVVFKDSGFENDTEKLNCYEILKAAGYQEADLLSI